MLGNGKLKWTQRLAMAVLLTFMVVGPSNALSVHSHVKFEGILDSKALKFIASRLQSGGVLELNSPGGDGDQVLNIANIVRDRGASIIVPSYCFSGCASFVFPAGTSSTLMPGAVLGFHNTSTSMMNIAYKAGLNDIGNSYRPYSNLEADLYDKIGVSRVWLTLPHAEVGPICYGFLGRNDFLTFLVQQKFDLFIPTDRQLHDMGYRHKGSQPTSAREVASDFERIFREHGKRYSWVFGHSPFARGDLRITPTLGRCAPPP